MVLPSEEAEMKECPLKIEDCGTCHWSFGRDKNKQDVCGIFSMAADLSALAEEAQKQTKLLEYLCKREQG